MSNQKSHFMADLLFSKLGRLHAVVMFNIELKICSCVANFYFSCICCEASR